MSCLLADTMSPGAVPAMIGRGALLVGEHVDERRPVSSSSASTRVPFVGPSLTSAGFEPVKVGEVEPRVPR